MGGLFVLSVLVIQTKELQLSQQFLKFPCDQYISGFWVLEFLNLKKPRQGEWHSLENIQNGQVILVAKPFQRDWA